MAAQVTQGNCRFRNDDGTETTATFAAAQNANALSLAINTPYRWRGQSWNSNNGTKTVTPQLQCSADAGATWFDVNGSSTLIQSVASASVSDATATTRQLTDPTSDGANFVAGKVMTSTGKASASVGLATTVGTAEGLSEHEFCFQCLSAGSYQFKMVDGGNSDASYNVTNNILTGTFAALGTVIEEGLNGGFTDSRLCGGFTQ